MKHGLQVREVVLPFVRSENNYDRDAASAASALHCLDVSLAKQSFREECDINTIVARFGLSGELPQGARAPTYADFGDVVDFHSAMNAVAAARESFDQMPAKVRARFNNDPGAFVDFCSDVANLDEVRKLGLLVPEGERIIPVAGNFAGKPGVDDGKADQAGSDAAGAASAGGSGAGARSEPQAGGKQGSGPGGRPGS